MASAVLGALSGGLLDGVSKVINSIRGRSPEDAAALEGLKEKYSEAFLNADLQQALAQSEINKAEATSDKTFIAGWRPFIGWVCGAAFGSNFVIGPFVQFFAHLFGKAVDYPFLDMSAIMPVLIGMLGLGAYRSYEKVQGADGTKAKG